MDVRAPRRGEAGAIADLLNAHSQALFGVDALTAEEIEHWFSMPKIDPANGMRVAVGDGGVLLGYADVDDGGADRTRFWIDLRLRPGVPLEAGDALLAAMEQRAAERAAPGALLRGFQTGDDAETRGLYERRGYRLFRLSLRMEALARGRAGGSGAGRRESAVRVARREELPRVRDAVEEAFADHWEAEAEPFEQWEHFAWDRTRTSRSGSSRRTATRSPGRPSAVHAIPATRDTGWVASLERPPPMAPARTGERSPPPLVRASSDARGRTGWRLGVDAENTTGAVRVYEGVGMHIARTINLFEKPLD